MSRPSRLSLTLLGLIAAAAVLGLVLGETVLSLAQMGQALTEPGSGPAMVFWQVRAPRVVTALMVGAALGLSGAVMQGLLRNPLADPGVLGVSAAAALAAATAIVWARRRSPAPWRSRPSAAPGWRGRC